jgi:hypothetical protein
LTVGSVSADMVAVEARKAAQRRGTQQPPTQAIAPRQDKVVSLTERHPAELPGDDQPLPSTPTTTCSARPAHESIDAPMCHRASRDRLRHEGAAMPTIRDRFEEIAAAQREQRSDTSAPSPSL